MNFPFTDEKLQALIEGATKYYWTCRNRQARQQTARGTVDAGTRGQVTAGKHMDGFAKLVRTIGQKAGFTDEEIFFNLAVPVPGYYRPQKNWDVVFLREGKLVAAIELKSQSGSFGNNFNNRSEEVIGVSRDFWLAFRERAFGVGAVPWLGYLFFLEEDEKSTTPVALKDGPLPPLAIFNSTSYLRRYEILCERLVLERDFNSTALLVSDKKRRTVRDGGQNVTAAAFFKSLFKHLLAAV